MPASTAASRKAKGRRLQNFVRDKFRQLLAPWGVEDGDINGAPMGVGGVDVQLSPKAKKLLPVAVECKNTEANATIYKYWNQANANKKTCEPVLVIKANRKRALAVIDFDYYIALEHKRIMEDRRD